MSKSLKAQPVLFELLETRAPILQMQWTDPRKTFQQKLWLSPPEEHPSEAPSAFRRQYLSTTGSQFLIFPKHRQDSYFYTIIPTHTPQKKKENKTHVDKEFLC